jgi:DNA-binding FrmR family transcriptional regulator
MIPRDLSKDIKTRLQSINGQINGLINMLDEDTDPDKILIQFKAAQKGLDKAHFLLLDETYRKALAIKISETVEACPGDCGNEDRIEFIRKQFPDLELDTLTSQMKEIDILRKRIDGNDLDKDGSS